MKIANGICWLGLGAALLVGCGKKEESGTSTDGSSGAPASATGASTPAPTPSPVPTPVPTPKPVNNDTDANAIRGCCAALRSAAGSEKDLTTKGKLTAAAGVCDGHVATVKTGAMSRASALGSIRASAGGKPLPSGCN